MTRMFFALATALSCAFAVSAAEGDAFPSISKIINLYLDDKPGEAQMEALDVSKKAEESEASKSEVLLLKYLASASGVKEWHVYFAAEKNPALLPYVSLAVFARKTAMEKELDAQELEICVDNYIADAKASKSKEISDWNAKAELWKKWVSGNLKFIDGLPPLLNKKSKKFEASGNASGAPSVDFCNISLQDFTESRKAFSARPRPASLDFDQKTLQKYIDSLPSKELKAAEVKRCNYLSKTKKYIIRLLERSPYTGEIKLKNESFKGTVTMANENVLRTTNGSSKKNRNCKWDELAFEQYMNFFDYYGNQRSEISGGVVSKEDSRRFAAEDYLLLAVLCDWYGKYGEALKYLKKAVEISPQIKNEAFSVFGGL